MEVDTFFHILPSLYRECSEQMVGDVDVFEVVVTNLDPSNLYKLVCGLTMQEFSTASNGVAGSVWGGISRFIFGRNRASFRKNLYLKWKNNSHDIHNKMKQHKLNTSISRF